MNDAIGEFGVNPAYLSILREQSARSGIPTTLRILVVTDTEISTTPGGQFGVSQVIGLIRSSRVGVIQFVVDIALRSDEASAVAPDPGPYQPKFTGFRFDMLADSKLVIDGYEQIWIFGFKPGNLAGSDADISAPEALPASDGELAQLARWMDQRQGGVFATGDHDYLGASLCHRIPRIGTMRRWTNADGVPPIGGFGDADTADRIDTLRAPSPAYAPGWPCGPLELENFAHQGDLMPQPIQWVAWQRVMTGVASSRSEAHPVLTHPTMGAIDVMPDHAHEGLCRDTGTVPLGGSYDFEGTGPKPEYPDATNGGAKPEPTVIAYGSNLGGPPYNFAKGPQPARYRNPMVSVYDGHLAGVGRVATDSTWHHWFDLNIAAMQQEKGFHWAKISRYYINLAVWLAPPGHSASWLWWSTLLTHFTSTGFQEYAPKLNDLALGQALMAHLRTLYGSSWVRHVLWGVLDKAGLPVIEDRHLPVLPERMASVPLELVELAALGGLVRATMPLADNINRSVTLRAFAAHDFDADEAMMSGVRLGIQTFAREWRDAQVANAAHVDRLAT